MIHLIGIFLGVRAAGCTRDSPARSFLFAEIPLLALREKKYPDSRFSNPLARPNTIFDVIIEAHDAATVYDGNLTKAGICS